tara:strand:- start:456 stop:1589 length:1134 start_codon:yes stop_codon:yes gene_type:complete
MKFLIDRLAFRNALQRVEMGIDRKPTRPILGGVLIQAENHSVTLMATDLEIGIRYRMDEVQVDQPGWAVVPGRELVDVIKDTESETITLCIENGDRCTVTAGEDECVLVTMESCIDGSSDPEAFGSLPVLDGEADVVLNKEDFLVMVGSTRFSTSRTHNMRFATEGVLVEVNGKRVTFVGTDGRRLACIHRDSIGGTGEKRHSVLLPKVLDQILRFGQDENADTLSVFFLQNQVGFKVGNLESFGRVLDGEFPNYENVIPKGGKHVIKAHRESLSKKLRLASHFTQDSSAVVRMAISPDKLEVTAELQGTGKASATMEVDYVGEGFSASFNPGFILEGLKASHTEQIELLMDDPTRPAKFILGENYEYVVMPLAPGV